MTSIVLSTYAALVLIAVGLMIATFVGARVLKRRRELALLKAAGFTPAQLMLLTLIENVAIAVVGTTAGVIAGATIAPHIVKQTAALTGTVPVALDAVTVTSVLAMTVAVVAVATALAARRTGSATTSMRSPSQRQAGGPGCRNSGGISRCGSASVRRWHGRDARSAVVLALALGVGGVTAALTMESTLKREVAADKAQRAAFPVSAGPQSLAPSHPDPVAASDLGREQVRPIVWGLNTLLLLVIVANVLATTLLGVHDGHIERGATSTRNDLPRRRELRPEFSGFRCDARDSHRDPIRDRPLRGRLRSRER